MAGKLTTEATIQRAQEKLEQAKARFHLQNAAKNPIIASIGTGFGNEEEDAQVYRAHKGAPAARIHNRIELNRLRGLELSAFAEFASAYQVAREQLKENLSALALDAIARQNQGMPDEKLVSFISERKSALFSKFEHLTILRDNWKDAEKNADDFSNQLRRGVQPSIQGDTEHEFEAE